MKTKKQIINLAEIYNSSELSNSKFSRDSREEEKHDVETVNRLKEYLQQIETILLNIFRSYINQLMVLENENAVDKNIEIPFDKSLLNHIEIFEVVEDFVVITSENSEDIEKKEFVGIKEDYLKKDTLLFMYELSRINIDLSKNYMFILYEGSLEQKEGDIYNSKYWYNWDKAVYHDCEIIPFSRKDILNRNSYEINLYFEALKEMAQQFKLEVLNDDLRKKQKELVRKQKIENKLRDENKRTKKFDRKNYDTSTPEEKEKRERYEELISEITEVCVGRLNLKKIYKKNTTKIEKRLTGWNYYKSELKYEKDKSIKRYIKYFADLKNLNLQRTPITKFIEYSSLELYAEALNYVDGKRAMVPKEHYNKARYDEKIPNIYPHINRTLLSGTTVEFNYEETEYDAEFDLNYLIFNRIYKSHRKS